MVFYILFFIIALWIYLAYKITNKIYYGQKVFYDKIYVADPNNSNKKLDLHLKYKPFAKLDNPNNYITLFIGVFFLFFIRGILVLILSLFMLLSIYIFKNNENLLHNLISFITNLVFKIIGIKLIFHGPEETSKNEKIIKIYKKYLGKDYELKNDITKKFSGYIANHQCFFDELVGMIKLKCGFLSKAEMAKKPIIGTVSKALHSVYVDRESREGRGSAIKNIAENQFDFYNDKIKYCLMIFPEGTTSSGCHLLKFKKGAFLTLLPLRPCIFLGNSDKNFYHGCGASDEFINLYRAMSKLYSKIDYYELPVIEPNDFMFNNYKNLGGEKWEIYAEVCRCIISEIGGLEKIDKLNFGDNLDESWRYYNAIFDGFISTEHYSIVNARKEEKLKNEKKIIKSKKSTVKNIFKKLIKIKII